MAIKKIIFFLAALLSCGYTGYTQIKKEHAVKSPDGKTVFEVQFNGGSLQYRVLFQKKIVINWSALGIELNGEKSARPLSVVTQKQSQTKEEIPWIFGESDFIINHYNQNIFSLITQDWSYDIQVRAFNGSVAFRYLQKEDQRIQKFTKELTSFRFTKPSVIYQYNHESVFTPGLIDTMRKTCDLPATVTDGSLYISIGEAANDFFTKAELRAEQGSNTLKVDYIRNSEVVVNDRQLTPWRTISIASTAIGLHNFSSLNYRLSPPSSMPLSATVSPGKLIRSMLTTQAGMECIDFAVKHHYQYIMFDAGWYGAEFRTTSDPTKSIEAIDMQKVIDHGKAKDIGVILYVNYVGLKQKLDTILPLYKKWGVAGFKFGFVDGLTQEGISWLLQAIKKVNDYGFILNIHDNYKPTGLSRTYPALLTQEGIRGDENSPDAFHNTTLPFTRFLAGAADFTFCFPNPQNSFSKNIKVSKGQQLALPVIYYSPLQSMLWYGKPEDYTNEDEIAFYDRVPTVWNESVYLAGSIGENISVARRHGGSWYVGSIAGFKDWDISIPAHFLAEGKTYKATIYEDGEMGSINKRELTIKKGQRMDIRLKAKGGQAMVIAPL